MKVIFVKQEDQTRIAYVDMSVLLPVESLVIFETESGTEKSSTVHTYKIVGYLGLIQSFSKLRDNAILCLITRKE